MEGARTVALACDAARENRGVASIFGPFRANEVLSSTARDIVLRHVRGELLQEIVGFKNPIQRDKVIMHIIDPPHTIKALRNALSSSGKVSTRDGRSVGDVSSASNSSF